MALWYGRCTYSSGVEDVERIKNSPAAFNYLEVHAICGGQSSGSDRRW
jgi:hypothetical protein